MVKFFIISISAMLVFICGENAVAKDIDLPESLGRCLGVYKTNNSQIYNGFEDFDYFYLEKFPNQDTDNPTKDSEGKVYVQGKVRLKNETIFKFDTAYIKIIKIGDEDFYQDVYIKTVKINGISYEFIGKFLKNTKLKNGQYTKIQGKLLKYKNDKKVKSAKIPFYEFAEL